MLDAVVIRVTGGTGGHGIVSFHREKFVPRGGPDGGDGGAGGDVILRAVDDVYTLELYRAKSKFRAGDGGHGGPNKRHGARGKNLQLEVPVGTLVCGEDGATLGDLVGQGEELVVARGGRGGWGNRRFATSTNQAPDYSQSGHAGEEVTLRLELRLLADVGLIGLPNAGKSTLLSAMSNAKPRIASYPFTTLEPMLGVVNVGFERFTMADLPGLVEGASEGYGLGFEFLKHVRRCRVLLHLVDSSSPDPITDYELIEGELRAYDPGLAELARVLVVTKSDLDPATARRSADTLSRHTGTEVAAISALADEGVEALAGRLHALVKAEKAKGAQVEAPLPVLEPRPIDRFAVTRTGANSFRVEGRTAVEFVETMDLGKESARQEVYRRLARWGVAKALQRAGAQRGDAVTVGAARLTWEGQS